MVTGRNVLLWTSQPYLVLGLVPNEPQCSETNAQTIFTFFSFDEIFLISFFSFELISFKIGSAYVSEYSKKTKKECPNKISNSNIFLRKNNSLRDFWNSFCRKQNPRKKICSKNKNCVTGGHHPQTPNTFRWNPPIQLVIGYQWLTFLHQVSF